MDLVTGALGMLSSKLLELLKKEYKLQEGAREEVQSLSLELESMHAALRKVAAVPRDQLDEQDKVWAREVREASYDMEDILDTFLVRVDSQEQADLSWLKRSVKRIGDLFSKGKARHDISVAIEHIKEHLQKVAERRARHTVDAKPAATTSMDPRLLDLYTKVSQLVGIEEPRAKVIKMLTDGEDMETKIVSIVGFGGLGKTTLAKAVYENLTNDVRFKAFVPVGRNPDLTTVLKAILIDLDRERYTTKVNLTILNGKQLIDEVREFLKDKRVLQPALDWSDYFLTVKDADGLTAGDRVISEFWRLFDVKSEDDEEADRVFDNYVRKKVRDMMYQARVDAVKMYYDKKLNQKLDDKLARPIELKYEEYLGGKLKWCSKAVWPYLCRYWCSEEFLIKRKRGQESRLGSDDIAQNHGGSRPFGETRQVLEEKFGPQYATVINTSSAMKSGIKNIDESGRTGTISCKAQSIVDEYTKKCKAAHPDESEQQELDGKVLYDISGGMRHGRLAIANGVVRKVDVMSAVKEKSVVPTNSVSYRRLAKDNQRLHHANRCLQERLDLMGDVTNDLILDLYRDMKKEVPASLKGHLAALRAPLPTSLSHVGEDMDGEDMDANYMEGEDTDGEDIDNDEDLDVDGDDDEELDGDDDNANVGSNRGGMNDGSNNMGNMVI